jgi:hypothetical protein
MPDLGVIKQAGSGGFARFGKAELSISNGPSRAATNAGHLLLICGRRQRDQPAFSQLSVVSRSPHSVHHSNNAAG